MLVKETAAQGGKHGLQPPKWLVTFGANTGGPQALLQLLPQFPSDFPGAIVVIQQMRSGFTRVLVDQLSQICKLPVYEPEDGQALRAGGIVIAPAGSRLTVANVGDSAVPAYTVFLEDISDSPDLKRSRTDAAMISAAEFFGPRSIGVLLTGLGSDGREGMRAILNAGGATIVQDEASSVVYDLPASAVDGRVARDVLPLWNIAERIIGLVEGEANAAAA